MEQDSQFSQYSQKVIEHFTNPQNLGELKDADGIGKVGNAQCGDLMQLYIKVKDDKIEDVKFKTFGCCAAIATSSMITEMIKDKPLSELEGITNSAVTEALGGFA